MGLRVAAITNIYPTAADPAQGAFVEQQVKGLRKEGVDVRVLHLNRRARGTAVYREAARLVEELERAFEPDLFHVMYGGVLAQRATRARVSRPFVVSFCGSDLLGDPLAGWRRRLAARYGVRASQEAAARAGGIIVKSAGLRDAIDTHIDQGKVWVLPNGIDLDRFRPHDREQCRQELRWDRWQLHVLFPTARREPCKRYDLALAGVRRVRAAGVDAVLQVIPGVPQERVPVWLNAADAVILTSEHEGSPNIVKEALACNRPVVSVDVGDVAERIRGINGCHLVAADPDALAAALLKVAEGPRVVEGRSRVRDFSLDSVSARLAAIYQAVMDRAGERRDGLLMRAAG